MTRKMDPFNQMGKPISFAVRQVAYDAAVEMGVSKQDAFGLVNGMADALQKDQPMDAMKRATGVVDLTGAYRMMATLLAGAGQ